VSLLAGVPAPGSSDLQRACPRLSLGLAFGGAIPQRPIQHSERLEQARPVAVAQDVVELFEADGPSRAGSHR
jgi:hypothetical protein